MNFIFPWVLGIIIPIDELHHFSEGWPNHQPDLFMTCLCIRSWMDDDPIRLHWKFWCSAMFHWKMCTREFPLEDLKRELRDTRMMLLTINQPESAYIYICDNNIICNRYSQQYALIWVSNWRLTHALIPLILQQPSGAGLLKSRIKRTPSYT